MQTCLFLHHLKPLRFDNQISHPLHHLLSENVHLVVVSRLIYDYGTVVRRKTIRESCKLSVICILCQRVLHEVAEQPSCNRHLLAYIQLMLSGDRYLVMTLLRGESLANGLHYGFIMVSIFGREESSDVRVDP